MTPSDVVEWIFIVGPALIVLAILAGMAWSIFKDFL